MAETTSQRVNALFASYVATEAEQARLWSIGTAEADNGADALGSVALAIREQVFAIQDRTANADLVAARILLELMLETPWHAQGGPSFNEEHRLIELPMLEILSDRLTGEVRRQAAFALGTIGVEVMPEAPTPFALRMAAYRQDCDRYNTATTDDDGPNPDEGLLADLNAGKVTLASASDAAEAMRYVLDEDVIEDVLAQQMARYVLALLEGKDAVQGQPAGADAESIGSMMRELRSLHDRPPTEDEDDIDTPSEFEILRDRILATPPVSPRDVALQFMADTHWGASEMSDRFADQLAALSGQEAAQ